MPISSPPAAKPGACTVNEGTHIYVVVRYWFLEDLGGMKGDGFQLIAALKTLTAANEHARSYKDNISSQIQQEDEQEYREGEDSWENPIPDSVGVQYKEESCREDGTMRSLVDWHHRTFIKVCRLPMVDDAEGGALTHCLRRTARAVIWD